MTDFVSLSRTTKSSIHNFVNKRAGNFFATGGAKVTLKAGRRVLKFTVHRRRDDESSAWNGWVNKVLLFRVLPPLLLQPLRVLLCFRRRERGQSLIAASISYFIEQQKEE